MRSDREALMRIVNIFYRVIEVLLFKLTTFLGTCLRSNIIAINLIFRQRR